MILFKRLVFSFYFKVGFKMTRNSKSKPTEKTPNHLISEKSPYLLQHAFNPVEWYPWGEEAFKKAREENKPIFLSIGYSTCHWCHVMEDESFEDPEVAKLMNEVFVSIKVDREERPDIDKTYMTACQALTGGGGWPLTIIMTPEGKPFFAATYIPKRGRFGRSGMLELIPQIEKLWKEQPEKIQKSATQITAILKSTNIELRGEEAGEKLLHDAYEHLLRQFDEKDGGFGGAPKFPTPHVLLFLLRYWKKTGKEKAQKMRNGGIFDHAGFGFHRYSTDSFWLVPHFEKMLYDQALLAMAYTEAYQATRNDSFKRVVEEIFQYVLSDMRDSLGGFYSAEDADSADEEGKMEEGRFYLWKESEIRQILDEKDVELAIKIFNIKENGNYLDQMTQDRTGENILHLNKTLEEFPCRIG